MRADEAKVYEYIKAHSGAAMSMSEIGALVGGTEKTGRRIARNLVADGKIERVDVQGATSRFFCTAAQPSRKEIPRGFAPQSPAQTEHVRGAGEFASIEEWEDVLTALGAESWTTDKSSATVFWSDGTMTEFAVEQINGGAIRVS